MIKRLITTILFLAVFGLLSFVDLGAAVGYILPICLAGIIGLLGYAVYYITWVRKSTLFCVALLTGLCPMIATAQVNPLQEDIDLITGAQGTLCGEMDLSESYNNDTLSLANRVVDSSKKLKAAGYNVDGGTVGTVLKCAEKYVKDAGLLGNVLSPTCTPLNDVLRKALDGDEACWPCNVTRIVIDSMQSLAVHAYEPMRSIAIGLMGIVFLFWIAIRVMLFLGQMGFARIGEFFTQMLQQMLIVLILSAVLYGPIVELYRMTVSPFIMASAGIANKLTALAPEVSGIDETPVAKIINVLDKLNLAGAVDCEYCSKMNTQNINMVGETFLDEGAVNAALCMVCSVYKQTAPFVSLGKTMTCIGSQIPKVMNNNPALSTSSMFSLGHSNMVILGWLFVITFSLFMFIVAFYLINIFLELAFTLIFTPIFVMCLAFKITRAYAKKAWELILHAMAVLISLSVGINLAMVLFAEMLPDNISGTIIGVFLSGTPNAVMGAFGATSGNTDVINELVGSGGGLLSGLLGGGGSGTGMFTVLLLLGFVVIGFNMIGAAVKVAEALSGTQGVGTGDSDMTGSLLMGIAAGVAGVKGGLKLAQSIGSIANNKRKERQQNKRDSQNAQSAPATSRGSFGGGDGGET